MNLLFLKYYTSCESKIVIELIPLKTRFLEISAASPLILMINILEANSLRNVNNGQLLIETPFF